MTATNRKTSRTQLASLLDTALTGPGNPAQAVYGYERGDLGGLSPVVMVTSAGVMRDLAHYTSSFDNGMRFMIQVWVRQADSDDSWTESDVEDALDDCEQGIAQVVSDNLANAPYWYSLEYAAETEVIKVRDLGGTPYLVELIPVICRVEDSA